ncbi:Extracellular solute-binding protein [Rhodovastum atsumiense]|uniref:Extracellular solute-binding protein n=1 Tax=Rhodovastum atsumiense TaxID=504468 RepID=A0A5M6IVG5_9PROT|nr:extracellular solute-binding protein [Rhodovastum atsumiense]KAA5611405.1 extracellular solute-binding protein [Rhodovastum atsumiense]CAH2603580.1 Extracellular solute-binding protein [Rhodovastum atsumiense]
MTLGRRVMLAAMGAALLGAAVPARATGNRVVVMTAYPDPLVSLFEAAFIRAHPDIAVQIVGKSSREAAEILRSPDQGGIDVYWAPSLATFHALHGAGVFHPLGVDRAVLPGQIGAQRISPPDGMFEAFEVAGYGIVANPATLARLGLPVPRDWRDLADARWAGQVVLPDAGHVGFSPAMYDIILQAEGWEHGWALISEIAGNARLEPVGPLVAHTVAEGAAAGLTIDMPVRSAIARGSAVTLTYPAETAFLPAHLAITAKAPHPEAARIFVDFLLGPQGQALLFRPEALRYPVRPDAYAAAPDGTVNPFARPEAARFAYRPGLGIARAGLVTALFEHMIARPHARLVALWADLHRAEAALARAPDVGLAATLAEARARLTAVPVSATEAVDATTLLAFRQRGSAHDGKVVETDIEQGWDAARARSLDEAAALVARVLAARPAAP